MEEDYQILLIPIVKINVHSSIVQNSILSGDSQNLLCVIPLDNLTRGYSFKFEPRRLLYIIKSLVSILIK